MKKLLIGLMALGSISAFANTDQNINDAKVKLVNAINSSVSPYRVTLDELNDRDVFVASYSSRFAAELTRKFGQDCIRASFSSTTELGRFLAQDSLTVDALLAPILESCY